MEGELMDSSIEKIGKKVGSPCGGALVDDGEMIPLTSEIRAATYE